MKNLTKPKRYTLTLPSPLHAELKDMATAKGISSRDVVLKCLKLGLIAFSIDDDSSKELILREKLESDEVKETKLILI